jgi:hypothetical protein
MFQLHEILKKRDQDDTFLASVYVFLLQTPFEVIDKRILQPQVLNFEGRPQAQHFFIKDAPFLFYLRDKVSAGKKHAIRCDRVKSFPPN